MARCELRAHVGEREDAVIKPTRGRGDTESHRVTVSPRPRVRFSSHPSSLKELIRVVLNLLN